MMHELNIKIKPLYKDTVIPYYATEGSAGLDCTAHDIIIDEKTKSIKYPLGFAIEIPEGYVGLLFPRSSVYRRNMIMKNCVGVIDSDFRGEVTAIYTNSNDYYNTNDRVSQLVIVPVMHVNLIITDKLSNTARGIGGYGSTGN